ncbi:MAG: FAD-dependent oxidoreductase [Patescibacteria group bacterium]|nr:FAD-dependent oxidoreductase [Patescibacteria group bacterium]
MKLLLTRRMQEAPGIESFFFKPEAPLSWKAGQFFHWILHHRPTDERGSDRWFTVSAAPSEGEVRLTTRFTSEKGSSFKQALGALKAGEAIEISDVDGDFVIDDFSKPYVFVAGGIGITPFRSILIEAAHAGAKPHVTLLWNNRDEHFPFKQELDALAANNPDFTIHYLVAPQKIDEEAVKKYVPDITTPAFYVSGPEPMVESLGAMLKGMGVSPERLKQDWFPGYPAE